MQELRTCERVRNSCAAGMALYECGLTVIPVYPGKPSVVFCKISDLRGLVHESLDSDPVAGLTGPVVDHL